MQKVSIYSAILLMSYHGSLLLFLDISTLATNFDANNFASDEELMSVWLTIKTLTGAGYLRHSLQPRKCVSDIASLTGVFSCGWSVILSLSMPLQNLIHGPKETAPLALLGRWSVLLPGAVAPYAPVNGFIIFHYIFYLV